MFGENLKKLRIARGLSQQELGDLTQLGQSNISAWERGGRSPPPECLIKLATFFGCTIDSLVGYSSKAYEDDELLIIQQYRSLNQEGKDAVKKCIDDLLDK